MFRIILLSIFLTGCLPEEPAIPTGAMCSMDGFVFRPVIDDITQIQDMQLILDDSGEAMTCVFTYG